MLYLQVGRGLAVSILDLYQINPWSRLPTSEYSTLHGIRQHLLLKIGASQKKAQVGKRRLEKRSLGMYNSAHFICPCVFSHTIKSLYYGHFENLKLFLV